MILLAALTLLFFAPALLGNQFFYRDISQNHYPMRTLDLAEMSEGRLPLWNPHLTFGQPLLANPNYMVLHPTTLLFAVMPFDAAFRWGIVLQFLLAAVGTYALLRDLGVGRTGAWLAGAAFAFCGPVLSLGNLYNVLGTVAWFPAAVWLTRRAVIRGRPGWCLAAAATFAVEIIAGEPLTILATLVFGFLFATRFAGPTPGTRDAEEPAGRLPWGRRLIRMGAVVVLAGLLAAPQILPTLELMPLSERGAGFGYDIASKWSTHPVRLWEMLVPGWFGDPTQPTPLSWWGEGFFESSLPFLLGIYLGGPLLLLAVVGLSRLRKEALVRFLAITAVVCLLLALGRHVGLYGLLFQLPGFDRIRYPSKFLLLVAFCVACLAGLGMDRLQRDRSRSLLRLLLVAGGILTGLPALAWTILRLWPGAGESLLHGAMGALGAPGGARDAVVVPAMASACARAALVSAGALALAWGAVSGAMERARPLLLLAGLVALDLYAANSRLNPMVDPSWYRTEPRLVNAVRKIDPGGRIYRHPRPDGFGVRMDPEAGAASSGFLWDRMSLRNVTGLQYGLHFGYDRNNERLNPGTSAFLSLKMEAEYDLEERIRTWRLGAIRFVLAYEDLHHPDLTLLESVQGATTHALRMYRLESTLPRARVVGSAEYAGHRDQALDRLRSPGFRPETAVLLPGPPGQRQGEPAAAPASLEVDEPGRVEVVTGAGFPGWLVLADTFFPGWEATVDGEPVEILPAYLLFRAVPVPAGEHRVVFTYRPAPLRLGFLLASLGLVGTLAATGWDRRRRAGGRLGL